MSKQDRVIDKTLYEHAPKEEMKESTRYQPSQRILNPSPYDLKMRQMTAKAASHISRREEMQLQKDRSATEILDESHFNESQRNKTTQGSYVTYFMNRFRDTSLEGREKRFNENSEKA